MNTTESAQIDPATAELARAFQNAAALLEFTPAQSTTIVRALRQQITKSLPPEDSASLLATVFGMDKIRPSKRPDAADYLRQIADRLERAAADISAGKIEPSRAFIPCR